MPGQQTQPAYKSGMRGKEVPSAQRKTEGERGKTPIRRLSIEKGHTGYSISVERHPPKPTKDKDGKEQPTNYASLHETHNHSDKESAVAHHSQLMDEMGLPSEGPNAEKVSSAG